MPEASQLWGFDVMVCLYQRRRRLTLFVCLTAAFRYCCCSSEAPCTCIGQGVSVLLYTRAVTIHMRAYTATSHVQLPQESGFLSPKRWEKKRHLQLSPVSFIVPASCLRKMRFLHKGKVCSFKLNREVMSASIPPPLWPNKISLKSPNHSFTVLQKHL